MKSWSFQCFFNQSSSIIYSKCMCVGVPHMGQNNWVQFQNSHLLNWFYWIRKRHNDRLLTTTSILKGGLGDRIFHYFGVSEVKAYLCSAMYFFKVNDMVIKIIYILLLSQLWLSLFTAHELLGRAKSVILARPVLRPKLRFAPSTRGITARRVHHVAIELGVIDSQLNSNAAALVIFSIF